MQTKSVHSPLDSMTPFETSGKLLRPRFRAANFAPLRTSSWRAMVAIVNRGWKRAWRTLVGRIRDNRKLLVVSATESLGEHRAVSIVQVERQRFLIGCGPSSVTLLALLPDSSDEASIPARTGPQNDNSADRGGKETDAAGC